MVNADNQGKGENGGTQFRAPEIVPKEAVLLSVENLTFGYSQQPLLYNVHLQVHSGEMVGLLGPNGSGKTTLLRLLSGVLRPQHGKLLLEGRNLQQWGRRGIAQHIAVVPQEFHVPFAFTVEQLVSLGRTPFTSFLKSQTTSDTLIIHDAMRAADITPLAQRIFNELSGGERQRVMLAMALAQQPKLLLLDEPTSHLDIKYQIEILELVQRLNQEFDLTVIAAMHDLNLAARYFPRLLLFQRGIVADAGPAEVLEPGLLKRVYGVNVQVGILRGAEHLSVLPPGSEVPVDAQAEHPQPQVHIMAGGGSGELIMRALADAHIPFTAGALNIGDSDHTLALRLAAGVITEQPYSPISPATREHIRAILHRVSLLILCPMPIGSGNLALLQEALIAAQRGLPVLLLTPTMNESLNSVGARTITSPGLGEVNTVIPDNPLLYHTGILTRDYTNGEAQKLMQELLNTGATIVESVGEALEAVKRCVILK